MFHGFDAAEIAVLTNCSIPALTISANNGGGASERLDTTFGEPGAHSIIT